MIIAIDFDGTIAQTNYPEIIAPMEGAPEVINKLYKDGNYIIINTCRQGKELLDAINWLLYAHINFDRVNANHPDNELRYGKGGTKIYADIYIDDHNLGGFPGWDKVYQFIKDPLDTGFA